MLVQKRRVKRQRIDRKRVVCNVYHSVVQFNFRHVQILAVKRKFCTIIDFNVYIVRREARCNHSEYLQFRTRCKLLRSACASVNTYSVASSIGKLEDVSSILFTHRVIVTYGVSRVICQCNVRPSAV